MRKFILLLLVTGLHFTSFGQNAFSFNCARDTTVDCSQSCFTLRVNVPDVRASTNNYTVNMISGTGGCFTPYVSPETPGNPTSLNRDDRYSDVIPLPFGFPFYGAVYNDLVATSNGIVTFDLADAGTGSQWGILNSGFGGLTATNGNPAEDLPSTLYDRAVIMGPYHDIANDVVPMTSPNWQIKYDVLGTAPHRRWVLSFFRIPLYGQTNGCSQYIENTHQIVLYEGLGIVEVLVFDKEICTAWNDGRAMIGMQNFDQNQAIMAPGRAASDAPWGSIGMNESWRFTPSSGASLLKRVELFNLSGTLIATGTTAPGPNNTLTASFPNVCTPTTTTYIIKSTYSKFDDPNVEIYGADTFNVINNNITPPLEMTVMPAPCGVGTSGTITVTNPLGANYQYSSNGTTYQASPVFTLPAGFYTITVQDIVNGCRRSKDTVINSATTLAATYTSVQAACPGGASGSITVNATAGTPGYTYSINNGPFQASNVFATLVAGTYNITIKDNANCIINISAVVTAGVGISATGTVINAACAGSASGSITVGAVSNGVAPYQYLVDTRPLQSSNVFTGLLDGNHTVTVVDGNNCTFSFTLAIGTSNGLTATVATTNAGCVGSPTGSITITPTNGVAPYQYSIDGGALQASNVFTGLAGGTSHTFTIKDANNCTVNLPSTSVGSGLGITTTATATNAACFGATNGTITVTPPANGTSPFSYTINSGTPQVSNVFNNLAGGTTYTVSVTDANGCRFNIPKVVGSNNGITATAVATAAPCAGANTGTITVTPQSGTAPYTYSIGSNPVQASNVFTGLAGSATYIIKVTDANGCSFSFPKTVNTGTGITATLTTENSGCAGNSGQIIITPNVGVAPFTYSLDGITFQTSDTIKNLAPGTYPTVTIKDAGGCIKTYSATIGTSTAISATLTTVNTSCQGTSSGQIIFTPVVGVSPFTYSLDGISFQSSDTIKNLAAGTYPNITIKDNSGCVNTYSATVGFGVGATATISTVNSACSGASTGQIIIKPVLGVAPFTYSIDGITFQTSDTIKNVAAGTYPSVTIKDAVGCLKTYSATVNNGVGTTATITTVNSSCQGASTGQIIITPVLGVAPFTYSLDGITFQASDTIKNLAAGTYAAVTIKDAVGCLKSYSATVNNGVGATATINTVSASCQGVSTGQIIITPVLGVAPFTYSLDGITFQTSDTIKNLAAGTYAAVTIKDAVGCLKTYSATVNNGIGATATIRIVNSSCQGASTGQIIITPVLGIAPFSYSLDGVTFQTSDTIKNLAAGTYAAVTIKDAVGCLKTYSATVNNGVGATATITTINSACSGASTGQIIITPVLGVAPFTYSLDGITFQAADTIRNLAAATYASVTIKDAVGCFKTYSATVNNGIGATATVTTVNSACSGASTGQIIFKPVLGIAPFTYSLDGVTFQAADTINNLAGGIYPTVTIKDAIGCVKTYSVTVSNSVGVTATLRTVRSACAGGNPTGQIIVTPVLGVAPFVYSLDGITFQNSDTLKNLAAATYTVTIKDANGCFKSYPATITNNTGVTGSAQTLNAACNGSATGVITVNALLGTAPFVYSIDSGLTYQSTNRFTALLARIYNISIKDSNNCVVYFRAQVNNSPGVTSTYTAVKSACSGAATGALIVRPILGTRPFLFSIDSGVTYQSSDTFRNLAAAVYKMSVKDSNNCIQYFNGIVTNNAGVAANTVIDPSSCATVPNGKITINTTAGIPPFRYSMDAVNFQTSNQFGGLFSGSYSITVIDSALCTKTLTVTVGNAARVVIDSVKVIRPTCNGLSNGKISVYARLGVPPYKYALNSGTYQTGNVFNNVPAATSDTIHVMDNSGCVKDTIFAITQPGTLQIPNYAIVQPTCTGNPDGSITINANGGTAPYQYTLDPNKQSGYQSANVFQVVKGTYTFSVKDAMGCIVSKTDSAVLNDTMRLEVGPDTTICVGSSVVIQPQTNNLTNVFTWTPAADITTGTNTFSFAPTDTTTYTLVAKWGICERTDNFKVNILHKPIAVAGPDTAICQQSMALLHGSATNVSGGVTYEWRPVTGLANADRAITPANPGKTFTYTLYVRDTYGCNFETRDEILITMQPPVPAFAGYDTSVIIGQPHQLHASGGAQYEWSALDINNNPLFNPPVNNPFVPNPFVTLFADAKLVVKVTDIATCVGTDTVLVRVYNGPTYYVPNAFSPNGDGVNDKFTPRPVGIVSTDYFRVFNRYGQLVFDTKKYEDGWDGFFKGTRQAVGAYVWMIKGRDINGKTVEMKGTVLLVQ